MRARFAELITRLSARLGTPVFEPHITLAGIAATEADGLERGAHLARALAPITVTLTDIAYSTEYFRCLYVRALPDQALAEAYRRACATFGITPGEFMPHLSLVYGNVAAADKERIIAEIGRRLDIQFTVERLALYLPEGRPETWRRVGDFPLARAEARR